MNKKLVALAVGGAFALPFAAQAQTANVTLYGRLNMDFELVNGSTCQTGTSAGAGSLGTQTGANQSGGGSVCSNAPTATPTTAVTNPTVNRVSSNSSRFGMRGTESLGGGLNAVFQIESTVFGDTGANSGSNIATRETFVGLQGSWGRVIMGKFLMPQDDLHGIFGNAPTFLTSALSTANLWAFGNLSKAQGGWDARTGNNVRYDSPNWNGFTGALQYSTRDDSGNTQQTPNGGDNGDHPSVINHANVWGGNVIYNNGPLQAGVSFEYNNRVRNAFTASTATWTAPNLKDWDWTVTGSYNFGTIMQGFGLQIGLVYENTRYQVQDPAATPGSSCRFTIDTGTCTLRRDFWAVSATVPVGGGKFYAFYGWAGQGKGSAADGTSVGYLTRGGNTKSAQGEVSYSYALSPRTTVWAGWTKLFNQCRASYTFNINSYNIAVNTGTANNGCGDFASGRPQAGLFGITHLF
ncbi:MAG TPA: porin [Casimicrobiaceae bacterium]|nr:porin [Casimicrobiaceae bacterium]